MTGGHGSGKGSKGGKGGGLQNVGVKPSKNVKGPIAPSTTPIKRPKKGPNAPKTKPKDVAPKHPKKKRS